MKQLLLLALLASALRAQPPIAPTDSKVGKPRGENVGGYNILNTFETGARFATVDGNESRYRSDVNFRPGVRLLSSGLSIHSREGQGRLFDELILNTQGLGNDPYQNAQLRLSKNKLYRYELQWRSNAYYNPGLGFINAEGATPTFQHFLDTVHQFQDQTLTLLPQSNIQFFAGYSSNSQNGPGLSTVNFFEHRGNEFNYFSEVRRRQQEFRLGGEVKAAGVKLFWQRGWEWFKDDAIESSGASAGNNPDSTTRLTSLTRGQPIRGTAASWRLNAFTERKRWHGLRDFIFDERAIASQRTTQNRQFLLTGNGRRPVTTGNLTVSIFPTEKISVSNHTGFHNTRMEGEGAYREFNNSTQSLATLNFESLGIRNFTNTTDVNIQPTKQVGFFTGYQYSNRRIQSVEQIAFPGDTGQPDRLAANQTNRLHTGVAGLRLRPTKPLQINFDAEIGRADRPFFTTSERNFHALGARLLYKQKNFQFSAQARNKYNFNSVSLFSHSSRARHYGFDGSWTPRPNWGIDGGYTKTHLDTLTGLFYFASFQEVATDRSFYVSNLHSVFANVRTSVKDKVDLVFGYSRVQDTGDGRASLAAGGAAFSSSNVFRAFQTYPLSFQSPMARVSVRLNERLRANFGYQYYGYNEKFLLLQDYRAHTGYASLLWSF
jgi:hypothetical protein